MTHVVSNGRDWRRIEKGWGEHGHLGVIKCNLHQHSRACDDSSRLASEGADGAGASCHTWAGVKCMHTHRNHAVVVNRRNRLLQQRLPLLCVQCPAAVSLGGRAQHAHMESRVAILEKRRWMARSS